MNALERLLRPLVGVVNRQIRAKTPARDLCRELDGRVVAVRVRDSSLAVYFQIGPDELELLPDTAEPDAVITATILTLATLAVRPGDVKPGSGSIELTGDAGTAQAFQRLLAYGRPDLEEELSGVIGDAAAHGLGDLARSVSGWARSTKSVMEQNIAEYLQEESRSLPSRYEVDRFRARVDTLRDDTDRLAARLTRLEARSDR